VQYYYAQSKSETEMLAQNAFSDKLSRFGFNLYAMLVVDILHEFELGVWKALFLHLLRIVEATDKALLDELDRRYAIQVAMLTRAC
jgi:hypothetical protein